MRSIVLLVLAVMALAPGAAACGCSGGLDGVGGPKMMSDICPEDYAIRGPRMTFQEDARYGVALSIDPAGGASMAFVGGEDGRRLGAPAQGGSPAPSGGLTLSQQVAHRLNLVPGDLGAFRGMMGGWGRSGP